MVVFERSYNRLLQYGGTQFMYKQIFSEQISLNQCLYRQVALTEELAAETCVVKHTKISNIGFHLYSCPVTKYNDFCLLLN